MEREEEPGAFYLGRRYDVDAATVRDERVVYDGKDLTTHAVCVGMTGSGKTGLGIALIEEAALDGIPALVIDPKGDMGNLLLTFPELRAEDFRPWIDPAEAARRGQDPDAFAAAVAEEWKGGLARWGEDGERIRRLRESADFAIYTPGSRTGLPLTVLRSFAAPPPAIVSDGELFADRIQAAVSGLLGLIGLSADPVQSREAILLANLLQTAWAQGRDLAIADLIRQIQAPPFERLGVLDVESFYPQKERTSLALALNGLLASPGFAQWLEGEPLEIERLLFTPGGRPRVSVLSIAHLSDAERMFFVTILLNEVVAWMRGRAGTSGLRAILYMDEIFGYFPPTKEPPSKRPMLTLLKQARAYGLGVVLATQNPVDLDYKGLANTGTWLIGRLQTERDKLRVLDGLEGAMVGSGRGFDRARIDTVLSALGKRVFLLNNVHADAPEIFQTRWCLSYLRGPLSREQVKALADPLRAPQPEPPAAAPAAPEPAPERAAPPEEPELELAEGAGEVEGEPPPVPHEIPMGFLSRPGARAPRYRPVLLAGARLHYVSAAVDLDAWTELHVKAPLRGGEPAVDWDAAEVASGSPPELDDDPRRGATFAPLPAAASRAKAYASWRRELASHLYRSQTLVLWKHRGTKLASRRGEERTAFARRVLVAVRAERAEAAKKLAERYATRLERAEEAVRKARERVGREEEQLGERRTGSLISIGASILGAFFGKKTRSVANVSRAGSAARSVSRAAKEKGDVERARRELAAKEDELRDLRAERDRELAEAGAEPAAAELALEEVVVRPRKSDVEVDPLALAWEPS